MMSGALKRFFANFENNLAGLLMAAVLIALCLQVVTRYVFNSPLAWTEEVSRHLFVWMVFFGASGALADRGHVAVEILASSSPPRVRRALSIASNLIVLFFLGNVFYWGSLTVRRTWNLPTATLELPQGLVYAVFPITAVLMTIRILIQVAEDVSGRPVGREPAAPPGVE